MKHRQGQYPSNKVSGLPIEFVIEPHPGFKAKASIDRTHPDIASEWYYVRNGSFGPEDFTFGSHVNAWWRCDKEPGHTFRQTIKDRCRGRGCPYCAGKFVSPESAFALLYPAIAREWDADKNGGLLPFDVTAHSHRAVWWRCKKKPEHVWQRSINARTLRNVGCPHCRNERKLNLADFPDALPFFDRVRNKGIDPFSFSTKLRVWWKCPKAKNHRWLACFRKRSSKISCPYCRSLAVRFPKIAKELHPHKNGASSALEIAADSHKEVWWKCRKNGRHVWQESPRSRIRKNATKANCPFCPK